MSQNVLSATPVTHPAVRNNQEEGYISENRPDHSTNATKNTSETQKALNIQQINTRARDHTSQEDEPIPAGWKEGVEEVPEGWKMDSDESPGGPIW